MQPKAGQVDPDALLEAAKKSPQDTPFDYIIVGSGAGGGPLAARLALEGRSVLVIEAGVDPATGAVMTDPQSATMGPNATRPVYAVPCYNGASTEDPEMSWQFSVRHYDVDRVQAQDSKYNRAKDASLGNGGGPKGGIFYPRAAALGGCTAHHAMVMVRPNDEDWDRIAEETGDESWRSDNMAGYFAKIEECLYYQVYKGFAGKLLGGLLRVVQWLAALVNPKGQLDPGGHGSAGWQKTSFIDPLVVWGIVRGDRTFRSVLLDVLWSALADRSERSRIKRWLARLQVFQFLDPNVRSPDVRTRASRLSLIPMGTDGRSRCGVREHLLDVARRHPDRLLLKTGTHVVRVLFENDDDGVPRAVGVHCAEGAHLYGASPLAKSAEKASEPKYFARREVILCGGTFNTPQLLMLSGIGDAKHLNDPKFKPGIGGLQDAAGHTIAPIVNLPGVGKNLQDRYEVSVISRATAEFSTLEGAHFDPAIQDRIFEQWKGEKIGLYTTNGCALAMMISSDARRSEGKQPDLFVFGVPAAFRGYYWGWSKDLLHGQMGDEQQRKDAEQWRTKEQRNLWSWVILKAYTKNNSGTVRLHSPDSFASPEIIFNSFSNVDANGDPDPKGPAEDVAALRDAVREVRAINRCIRVLSEGEEIQPGPQRKNGSDELEQWLRNEAWGHHACGTCKIGQVPWQADVDELTKLEDEYAVLDSKFRVHGVRGLRVVDASAFPRIPGYFIVTSVFMLSEKAADTLLADSREYPSALQHAEAASVQRRRAAAGRLKERERVLAPTSLPEDTIGLALSGGGIRSATFCLGVLQALAGRKRLREIDFVSTVSGGSCAAGFLGRLFTRIKDDVSDAVGRVQEILTDKGAEEIWWLRRNADYIASGGWTDVETNIATVARNLGAVHLLVGALLFAIFGGLRWVADTYGDLAPVWPFGPLWHFGPSCDPCGKAASASALLDIGVSFWWWAPVAVLITGVVPFSVGYWLTPAVGRRYAPVPLLLWVVLLASAANGLSVPEARPWAGAAILALLFGWVLQEVARWRVDRARGASAPAEDTTRDNVPSTLVRNRLTRSLGALLVALVVAILWVLLDSLARWSAEADGGLTLGKGLSMLVTAPVVLLFRLGALSWLKRGASSPGEQATQWYHWALKAIVGGVAFILAAILVFFLDLLAHVAFDAQLGVWTALTALACSIVIGRWFRFLNLSSLQQSYGQKLVRTYLGATNEARVRPAGTDQPKPVEIPDPDDDMFFDDYHPERSGGPLHLINTCVNDTVAGSSGRQLRDDKGLPLCVGPEGMSVGLKYHALWQSRTHSVSADRAIVRPLPVAPDPNAFHVLGRRNNANPEVERLRVGQWIAISAAAVATGAGRYTSAAQSLLLGLLNLRVGYWWDSNIPAGARPGRYPANAWRQLKALPANAVRTQATLLNEWRGYFPGPSERLWYLSDGGHFENTGLYELIRRRLPFIIAVDAAEDADYKLGDLAVLTRQVRLDFGAEIHWVDPGPSRTKNRGDWARFDDALGSPVPERVRSFIEPDAVGALYDLKRESAYCSALARITYAKGPARTSWLLLLKANLAPPQLPVDVRNYAALHATFPNEATADQFFRDDQWESYRALGQCAGEMAFREDDKSLPGKPVRQPPPKPIDVAKLSVLDTLLVQWHVTVPMFFRGLVGANRWFLSWRVRCGAGWQGMRFLSDLQAKYGGADHLWSWFAVWAWFPLRRTLFVFSPETMEPVLASDENAADPLIKRRALSRFVPDGLIISSGDEWVERRKFNEHVLSLEQPVRHGDALVKIVSEETKPPGEDVGDLTWPYFKTLGERVSQRVIAGRLRPKLGEDLARLVRCSNWFSRDGQAFDAFYKEIGEGLKKAAIHPHCLMAEAPESVGKEPEVTKVQRQIGFWLYVLNDAIELHVPRTLALIAAHPDAQERVRAEIERVGTGTADAIDHLVYLDACIREQLRLWTPVPLLLRRALHPFSLRNEIPLAAEQQILMHVGFYHRDPRFFGERANRFMPDVVEKTSRDQLRPTYFFSADRQRCAGQTLVMFLLKATLASLLRQYRFELIGPTIEPDRIPYLYDHFRVRLRTIR